MKTKQWRLRAAVGLASFVMAGSGVATALPAAADGPGAVRINEVIQDNDAIADGVELINTGQDSVDVSGWTISDNKPENKLILPAGSIIAPRGYLMVTVDDKSAPVSFGLGKADEANLLGPDGTTLVDSYSWSAHTSTSYGRCADGTGDFVVTPKASPGAANICQSPASANLVINEVESSNGDPGDWIELMNTGVAEIQLAGLTVRDSDDTHIHTITTATTLAPGAFMVIEEADLGFGLGSNDLVRLFDVDGATLIDSHDWTAHAATSLGRCPDGVGEFMATATPTKGAANDCAPPAIPAVVVNEVETSNGNPGDWIELFNAGSTPVDLSAWVVRDSDDSADHASVLPDGAIIEAGGFYVVEEGMLGYGLGKADSARIYLPGGHILADSYSWTAWGNDEHAPTTFGRCADGTGDWAVTTTSTKGAPNDCGTPIRINEIESSGGNPGDWVEITNIGATAVDVSGFAIRDDSDKAPFLIPSGTMLAAGSFLALDVESAFGLGKADAVRLLDAAGVEVDAHGYSEHAATTWGRCPDGTGEFVQTRESTKGAANACVGDLLTTAWPGSPAVATADVANTFGSDMSGLAFEPQESSGASSAAATLWAVNNGAGTLHRLVQEGSTWVEQGTAGWAGVTTLKYSDGAGEVDAEGVAMTAAGSAGGVFVASERNNAASGTSRPSILRYDSLGAGDTLAATAEWNLVEDLPVIGANAGLEGIAWIPDTQLVAGGFIDETSGTAYNPADYPDHGDGLFFVGVEANGMIYAYALDQDGTGYNRVAAFDSGFAGVMELEFEAASGLLWAICDDTCDGRSATLNIAGSGEEAGTFAVTQVFERPTDMPNLNNEGFAIAPEAFCAQGARPVVWSDDGQTEGHALRSGSINCAAQAIPETPVETPETPVETPETPVDGPADGVVDGGVDEGPLVPVIGQEPAGNNPGESGAGSPAASESMPANGAAARIQAGAEPPAHSRSGLAATGAAGVGPIGAAALLLAGGISVIIAARRRRLSNS